MGDLLPSFAGQLTPENPDGHYRGTCMDIDLKYVPVSATQFQIQVTTSNAKSKTCYDYIMFGTTEFVHFEQYFGAFKGNTLTFNMPTTVE